MIKLGAQLPHGGTRLAPAEQTRLDRMVRTLGFSGTARSLHVDPCLIQRLYQGGYARPQSVAKAADGLRTQEEKGAST